MLSVLSVLFAVVVAVCAAGSPAGAAEPGGKGGDKGGATTSARWKAAPLPPQGAPTKDARAYFYLEGAPGTVLKDTLALTNDSGKTRTFRLRGADAYNERGGGFAVRGEGRSKGPGTWLAPAQESVEVPPHTRAEVPFAVTVPEGAVPGDHPAAVVVSDGKRKAGVRLHLRVSGPTLAALSVENVSVDERDGGGASVTYTLVNRGNTALRPRLAIRAGGLFGPLPSPEARTLPVELLPGQRVTRHESWPQAPAADRADVRLAVTAEGGARDTATTSYTAVPWGWAAALGALLALAGGGAGWYVLRRRRASDGRERGAGQGDDADEDADKDDDEGDGRNGTDGGDGRNSGGQRELTGAAK
ncbi:COG1470 family protein [Streptomyces sp. NBC_01795]|uniref:COG1470 family protein n=1 Tax=Streptomyces sp. NBC_01795 TaxID=2975943 RepID=UPI003FA35126